MPTTVNPVSIFLPMLVVVLLTFIAFIRMAAARGAGIKAGQDVGFYRAHQGPPEPAAAVVAVRHYGNLFEAPVLFYAACLTAFVLNAVTGWALIFAWAYVAARLVQSAVHLGYNNPMHRGGAFMFGLLFVLALWVTVALAIFARL